MDARRQVGAVLVVAGVALALVGLAGTVINVGAPAVATASPTPATTQPAPSLPAPSLPVATAQSHVSVPPATAPPTAAPPTTAPTEDTLGLVRVFFVKLQAAIRDGNQELVSGNLGQAVIDRYGLATCNAYLAAKEPIAEQAFEIDAVHDPAPWDYVTDGRTTTIPDAITVDARVTGPDPSGATTTETRALHVEVIDGIVYWFTDCGTPQA